jgi:putative phosphoribosyl transferase
MIFQDRRQAGRALAQVVREECRDELSSEEVIVLGLPRGGVPVAFEVALALHRPLDVFFVRKLGVPGEEELAMGAVASGGMVVLQPDVLRAFRISQETIDAAAFRERVEVERREIAYRDGRPPAVLEGRSVILVDDGLATGATMKAAVRALRPIARRILVAVPVAAAATCAELRPEVDRLFCLEMPEPFHSVGQFYHNFDQITDAEVRTLLVQARELRPDSPLPG